MIYTIGIMIAIFIMGIIALIIFGKISIIASYDIKIKEAIKNIEILQEKELTLFNKIAKKLNPTLEEKVFTNVTKIKNQKLDMFEKQEEFYKLQKEAKIILSEGSIMLEKDEKNLFDKLKKNSIELTSIEEYYNDQVNEYNTYIKKFHNLLIRIFKHLKKLDTFTFKKVVEFEILEENH